MPTAQISEIRFFIGCRPAVLPYCIGTTMSNLVPFSFGTASIRVIDNDGTPWFVLRDLLDAIQTTTPTSAAVASIKAGLGESEASFIPITTTGGTQTVTVISEFALYYLLIRGQKVKALVPGLISKISGYKDILSALYNFEIPDDLPEMFVYAIREKGTGHIKLGISRDPQQRLAQLQTGNSQELELVAYRQATNRFAEERAIHADAAAYRLRGEWFSSQALGALQ